VKNKNVIVEKVIECAICGSHKIKSVIELKDTRIEDQYIEKSYLDRVQPIYPLALCMCDNCGYIRLTHLVYLKERYKHFKYESNTTIGLSDHFDGYAKKIIQDFSIPINSLVVDVGSSDGSMLASFKNNSMNVMGIEPAELPAKHSNMLGITTINDYLTEKVASRILREHGEAVIITANYMYANIDDLVSFTKLVSSMLSKDGIFVVETGYHPDQFKIKMFDYIYHEHFSYFTVGVLSYLFNRCDLEIIDAQKTKPKGGSIRIVAQKKIGFRKVSSSVSEIIKEEKESGVCDIKMYKEFSDSLQKIKSELNGLLQSIKDKGQSIVAFGASHSATTLIYNFSLERYIDYIIDDNELKHGLFSPGHHIPVHPTKNILLDKPDYILILAWQHKDSILKRHKGLEDMGVKFIIPLPEIKIIG